MSTPIWIQGPADLDVLEPDELIAIDTEFHAERRYSPQLFLVQIGTRSGRCLLLDPLQTDVLQAVGPRLASHPWLVHAGSMDLPLLHTAFGSVPTVVLDTQIAAGLVLPKYPAGLAWLLETVLDLPMDKSNTLSDWSKRPLAAEQIAYAAADVADLHRLFDTLVARHPERLPLIHQACEEARQSALEGPRPRDQWRRIPGRSSLSQERTRVLVELAAWRMDEGARAGQAPHNVVANHVLLDLAKRRPTTPEALLSSRRAPKKTLMRHQTALLEQVAAGLNSTEVFANPNPGTLEGARLSWLQTAAIVGSMQASWGARLVLPPAQAERLAVGPMDLDLGWRAALIGPMLDTWRGAGLPWPTPAIHA